MATLDEFFTALTYLGDQKAYLLLVPVVLWTVHRRWGLRLAMVMLLSLEANLVLKNTLQTPRPPPEMRLAPSTAESPYGFPSGHAQATTTFWSFAALHLPRWRPLLLPVGTVVVILVSFSRIYLNMHYPEDVAGGILLGLVFAMGAYLFGAKIENALTALNRAGQAALALLVPALMVAAFPHPDAFKAGGMMSGIALGAVIEPAVAGSRDPSTLSVKQKAVRLLVGFPIAGVILFAPERLLAPSVVMDWVRYFAGGLAITLLAPAVFASIERGKRTGEEEE